MKVALLYNGRPSEIPANTPDDAFEEYDSPKTIASICAALSPLGIEVEPVVADSQLPWRLTDGRYDFVFNIAEGEGRRYREATPAAVCELLKIPYTASDAFTLAITLDKWVARRVVSPDLPIVKAVLVNDIIDRDELSQLQYPVIVKPNDEGSSKGIRENSVAIDPEAAAERCRRLVDVYGCPVLVEEFLSGMEVTVGIVGNWPTARVLGMMEIAPVSDNGFFVYSVEIKRDFRTRVQYHNPPRLDSRTTELLRQLALRAFRLLGCRDVARMDFRLNNLGQPFFLECNPLPGLNPESGDIVILCRSSLSYEKLVQGILLDAMVRVGVPTK